MINSMTEPILQNEQVDQDNLEEGPEISPMDFLLETEAPPNGETTSEEEIKEEETEVIESPEELVKLLRKELDNVKKQADEMRKTFTEESEIRKRLREEEGIDNAFKADKQGRKTEKKLGEEPDSDFIYADFYRDDLLKQAREAGELSDVQVYVVKNGQAIPVPFDEAVIQPIKKYNNHVLNTIRMEARDNARKLVEEALNEFKPVKEEWNKKNASEHIKTSLQKGSEKYKELYKSELNDNQKEVIIKAIVDDSLYRDIVKEGNPDKIARLFAMIQFDPAEARKSILSKPAPRESKAEKVEDKSQRGKPKSFAEAFDNILGF